MARHIALGNQQLLINIDQWLQVRDIYFPHVGQYNHLVGHAHRMALLENDQVSWINDDKWEKKLNYHEEALIAESSATNHESQLSINFEEAVHCESNIFIRKVTVKNNSDHKRSLRYCFKQDFHLYADGIGDTAFYAPKEQVIIHYKRKAYFLIGVTDMHNKSQAIDYDIGPHTEPSKFLSKRPIHQGKVESVIGYDFEVEANSSHEFCFYMVVGEGLNEVYKLNSEFLASGYQNHLNHIVECQGKWLGKTLPDISVLPERIQTLYKRSLLVIRTQVDYKGAIIAANDSDIMQFNRDTYSYMWPRDGALVAIALIKAGYSELTKPFFIFCRDVLYKEGCLLHKYNPDRTLGSSWHPWVLKDMDSLPIQEDETALVLHALWTFYEYTGNKEFVNALYLSMIKPMGDFLNRYRYANGLPRESYDLWEERRGILTFTTSAVLAGLLAADKFGALYRDESFCEECAIGFKVVKKAMIEYLYNKEAGYFRRSVSFENGEVQYDETMDSAVYGIFEFDIFDINDEMVSSTMQKMKEWMTVKTNVGGIARYYNDYYMQKSQEIDKVPGNPWFICTLWYAKYVIKKAKHKDELKEALDILNWVADHALETGVLAEQLHPYTGEPLSVSPLTWSHAEFIDTITNYANKVSELDGKEYKPTHEPDNEDNHTHQKVEDLI